MWPDVISRWIWQRVCIKFCSLIGKSVTETLALIRQASGEESMSRTRKVQTHQDRKRRDTCRAKSKACTSFSLISRTMSQRICPGMPNSQFRTLLWSFTATAWKCAKTSPRTLVTKELAVASRQRTVSHFLLHHGIFYQKQHDCRPTPTLLFCFLDWSWNLKAAVLTQLRWWRQNLRRCWTPSQNTTSRMHTKWQ
jgi:hypothetical protein